MRQCYAYLLDRSATPVGCSVTISLGLSMWRERLLLPSLLLVMRRDLLNRGHGFYKILPRVHCAPVSHAPPTPTNEDHFLHEVRKGPTVYTCGCEQNGGASSVIIFSSHYADRIILEFTPNICFEPAARAAVCALGGSRCCEVCFRTASWEAASCSDDVSVSFRSASWEVCACTSVSQWMCSTN